MLTSDRIAAGRLRGLKWGIVVAALVANPSYAPGSTSPGECHLHRLRRVRGLPRRDLQSLFKEPALSGRHRKTRQVERPGLRSLPRSRLQACRNAVADRHCEPVESLAKAHRRGFSEMSLQSAHTNWADPRLACEKLRAVHGVSLGAQGIQPSSPVEEPASETGLVWTP